MPHISTPTKENGRAPAKSATAEICVPDEKDNDHEILYHPEFFHNN